MMNFHCFMFEVQMNMNDGLRDYTSICRKIVCFFNPDEPLVPIIPILKTCFAFLLDWIRHLRWAWLTRGITPVCRNIVISD